MFEKEKQNLSIIGVQKLTLLDYPGHVACTLFTPGCNFRCPFCHNSLLLDDPTPPLDEDEIIAFLKKRIGVLSGVAITGGEPTLQNDLKPLMARIKALGYKIKLDSNGTNPSVLREFISEGLVDRIAMDIKNSPAKYAETAGVKFVNMDAIIESRDLLMTSGIDYEFRTTVVRGLHTKESLIETAEFIKGAKEYYLQLYKASDMVLLPEGLHPFTIEEMNDILNEVSKIIPNTSLRGV